MRSRKHCSDELLIAHLDGELSLRADRAVTNHLKTCWWCRARLTELEEQAQAIAKALHDPIFPASDRVAAARNRFSAWQEAFEQTLGPAPQLKSLPSPPARLRLAVAACVVACLGGLAWRAYSRSAPKPAEVLAATETVEVSLAQTPLSVRQSFRVEITGLVPAGRKRIGRLEVWSDSGRERSAWRWKDDDGALRHAAWRPGAGREYVFDWNPGSALVAKPGSPVERMSLTELYRYGLEPEQIEAGFVRWLRTRNWHPIHLGAEIEVFATQDGTVLRAERIRSSGGEPAIRLSALRARGQIRVELVLEVDANTYRPRLERVVFEALGRKTVLCLTAEPTEFMLPERVLPAVFQPDVPVAQPESMLSASKSARILNQPSRRPPLGDFMPAPPAAPSQLALEIEARYALHRARACLGEPIEVVPNATGGIRVRGLVRTSKRKAELLAALAELQPAMLVSVSIKTVDEAASEAPPPSLSKTASTRVQGSRLPIQEQIERFFSLRRSGADPKAEGEEKRLRVGRKVTELANDAVTLSDQALAEAWALRRLAQRYPAGQTSHLPTQSRWLLEAMLRDHMIALHSQAGRIRALLEPVLSSIAGGSPAFDPLGQRSFTDSNWNTACLTLFDRIGQVNSLVHGLFAGERLPAVRGAEAVSQLLTFFFSLDDGFQTFRAEVEKEFPGGRDLLSLWDEPE